MSRNCAGRSCTCRGTLKPVDRALRRVDSLGNVVFWSYLFKTATSGETGLIAGAEGATAPETLRHMDRVRTKSGKRCHAHPPTG